MDGRSESAERPDASYGEGWEELRRRTLRRDGHACRRCGADDRTLQAHHVVPRSEGGPDRLENLITLCRPCHGVMHPNNGSFDDVRDEAPLFPDRDAPDPVAMMRGPEDVVCARCGGVCHDPTELVAYDEPPEADREYLILCKPCAGLLVDRGELTRQRLRGNHRFSLSELVRRRSEATVRPSVLADDAVAVRREPSTVRERLVDDTPLRFLLNGRAGRWTVLIVAACLMLAVLVL